MAQTLMKTIIRLRKDTEQNYASVGNTFIPADGEACVVQTLDSGIRIKIGDGLKSFAELPYIDEPLIDRINSVIIRGYYVNGAFCVDPEGTEQYVPHDNKIYVDNRTYLIYCWDSDKNQYVALQVPTATDTHAGIMKLYDQMGEAVDGTMTQRCTTTEINKKFEVAAGEDETLIFTEGGLLNGCNYTEL